MKKLVLSAIASLFLLAGCSDAYTNVSDPNTAVLKIGEASVTKSEIYTGLLANYGAYYIIGDATETILDNEVETTEEMTTQVDSEIEQYKEMYGESFESILQMYGHKDEEALKKSILYNLKNKALIKKYIEENFESLVETYHPRYVSLLAFSNEDDAQKAVEEINSGKDALDVATELGSSLSGEDDVVLNSLDNTLPNELISIIMTSDVDSEYRLAKLTNSDEVYVLKVISITPEDFKDAVVTALSEQTTVTENVDSYYFSKYHFHLYDKTLMDIFKEQYSNYLK